MRLFAVLLFAATSLTTLCADVATELRQVDALLSHIDPDGTVHVGNMRFTVEQLTAYRNQLLEAQHGNRAAFHPLVRKWPVSTINGKTSSFVPYVLDDSLSQNLKTLFLQACSEWESVANLTFVERTTEKNFIFVENDNTGNHSFIGMINGSQQMSLQDEALYVIAHEIGHAMGMIHEQSRSDRDDFVTINFDNIVENQKHNFDIVPGSLNKGPYDFDSTMHYFETAFSKPPFNLITIVPKVAYNGDIGQQNHLSELDKSGMAAIYPFPLPNLTQGPVGARFEVSKVRVNLPLTVSTDVVNKGVLDAGPFVVRYWLATDADNISTWTYLGDSNVAGLAVNASHTAVFSGTCPNVTPGIYYLVWAMDADKSVSEMDETDNNWSTVVAFPVSVNVAAAIQSPATATPNPAAVNEKVRFTVSATDADDDTIVHNWNFGDGTSSSDASPVHKYAATGTFNFDVTVTDSFGETASSQGSITIGEMKPVAMTKRKFALNFKLALKDSIDLTFADQTTKNFQYLDKLKFATASNGTSFVILIDQTQIDSVPLLLGKGKAKGAVTWNAKKGEIRYAAKNIDLAVLLSAYGATNTTTKSTVTIPFFIFVEGVKYFDQRTFSYSGSAGKSGKGM